MQALDWRSRIQRELVGRGGFGRLRGGHGRKRRHVGALAGVTAGRGVATFSEGIAGTKDFPNALSGAGSLLSPPVQI